MAFYLVGDIQGCDEALGRLLAEIDFSASRDTLYVLGDLVNRGPDSLATLRRLRGMGHSAQCVLGNHDLHLLAVAQGVRPAGRRDTLAPVLEGAGFVRMRERPTVFHGASKTVRDFRIEAERGADGNLPARIWQGERPGMGR